LFDACLTLTACGQPAWIGSLGSIQPQSPADAGARECYHHGENDQEDPGEPENRRGCAEVLGQDAHPERGDDQAQVGDEVQVSKVAALAPRSERGDLADRGFE